MKNCSVSQLKEVIANDNLKFYDSIELELTTDAVLEVGNAEIFTRDSNTFDVYNLNRDTLIADDVSSYTVGLSTVAIIPNAAKVKVVIRGKHNDLIRCSFYDTGSALANRVSFDIGQLENASNLFYVKLPNRTVDVVGTLNISKLPNIETFNCEVLNPDGVTLSIPEGTKLPKLSYLSYFRRFSGADAGLSADISCFADSTLLSTLVLNNNAGVTGSLDDLLDALYNSGEGKTSGNLRVELVGTGCTYDGVAIASILNFTFSASGWTQVV